MSGENKENKQEIPPWADPSQVGQEEKDKMPAPSPIDPKRDYLTIFKEKMDELKDAVDSQNAQWAHHLDRIAMALEKIANKPSQMGISPTTPKPPATPTPAPAPTPAPTPYPFMTRIKDMFPQDLQDMLNFNQDGKTIIIKPRRFLGSDNFAKIASIVRQAGGEYVSAGKESHFKVQEK